MSANLYPPVSISHLLSVRRGPALRLGLLFALNATRLPFGLVVTATLAAPISPRGTEFGAS